MIKHTGNVEPSVSLEEHEGSTTPYTKRVSIYGTDGTDKNALFIDGNGTMRSIVTIASTLTTTQGLVTLAASPNFIGLATTVIGSAPTLFAVVNTAAAGQSSIVLDTGTKWIGLATVNISNPTIYAVVNTAAAGQASVALDTGSKFIGLVTVANTVPVSGTFYQTTQPVSLVGQATLNASSNWIGLATVWNSNQPALVAGTAQIGSVTIANQPPLTTGAAWIGLATTVLANNPTVTTLSAPYSFYQQASLISGYTWLGFTTPGSNPTTATFRIQRVTANTGEVLFASGTPTYIHTWSAASLGSISYL